MADALQQIDDLLKYIDSIPVIGGERKEQTQKPRKQHLSPKQKPRKAPKSPKQRPLGQQPKKSPRQRPQKAPKSPNQRSQKAPKSPNQRSQKAPKSPNQRSQKAPKSPNQRSQKAPKSPKQKSQKAPKQKQQQKGKQQQKKSRNQNRRSQGGGAEFDINLAKQFDFRIGNIVECGDHPNADSMWLEKIEMGDDEPRQVISGLKRHYSAEEMLGFVTTFANLKPANLRGIRSHAMVFCAKTADGRRVQLMRPPPGAVPGERIWLEGHENEFKGATKTINTKKKNSPWNKLCPGLKSNDKNEMTYCGVRWMCSAGPLKCKDIPNAKIS